MKDNDVIKFIKDNYKLVIPIAFLLVVFIAAITYYQISISNNITKETDEKVYQYFYTKKYEYTATISKNRKDVIVDYQPKDININLDSTPIYYQKENIVIFPKDMSVIMPTLNCQEYLSTGYSYITHNKGVYNLTTNKYNKKLNHYFFYDSKDLYFFIEPTTLKVGKEEIKLSSLSYVIAKYGSSITYYDKKTDTSKTIETNNNDDYIENEYYKIYINRDTIDYQGSTVPITQDISKLNTIDMKG